MYRMKQSKPQDHIHAQKEQASEKKEWEDDNNPELEYKTYTQ